MPATRLATTPARGTAPAPRLVHDVLRSPGVPLDAGTRAAMEPRFGHSFADVRVHADARAAESARAVGAHAYAVGRDVVFGAGRYAPASAEGRRLIAHELAHVVQQRGADAAIQPRLEIGPADDPAEREAERAADAVAAGGTVRVSGGAALRLSRQDDAAGPEAPAAAPTCPVKDTGTLSEVSWGETSGLYPHKENQYQPAKWDAAKVCEILKMRAAVHAVAARGEKVHRARPGPGNIEQMLKKYHFTENFPAVDTEITDAGVKWFYLSNEADGPAEHKGVKGTVRVKGYGSFFNNGGGDVPRGDTWVHFYKLAPKAD